MVATSDDDILVDFSPVFRVHKDGLVARLDTMPPAPPSLDRRTGVESKDKLIAPKTGVFVRIFNPTRNISKKKAVIMYCHGGGFCSGSTFSPPYHRFLNRLASEAHAVVVSVEYRKATEYPLPAAYDDCWDALMWILSHHDPDHINHVREEWLLEHVDFGRLYIAGDSSGANVAHQVALRAGVEGLGKIDGLVLIQPFFWGEDLIGEEELKGKRFRGRGNLPKNTWAAARWGSAASVDDPWMNPSKDPKLSLLGCRRVLICVAEKDIFRDRGLLYGYTLNKSGWVGDIVVFESDGEDHAFQLRQPSSTSSKDLMAKVVSFVDTTSNNPHSKL